MLTIADYLRFVDSHLTIFSDLFVCILHNVGGLCMDASFDIMDPIERAQYAQIKDALINCLLERRSVNATVREAAMLMGCPIILTSSSYRVIAMEDLGKEVDYPIWQDAKRTGYCSADAVRRFVPTLWC